MAKRWGVLALLATMGGAAAACEPLVDGGCVDTATVVAPESVIVAGPVLVPSAVPIVSYHAVAPASVVGGGVSTSVVVAAPAPVAAFAVRPTIVRQRVVVRSFGVLRPRVRW